MLQNALFQALKLQKTDFFQLLLDQNFCGKQEFDTFLTLKRLHMLHKENVFGINDLHDTFTMSFLRNNVFKQFVC